MDKYSICKQIWPVQYILEHVEIKRNNINPALVHEYDLLHVVDLFFVAALKTGWN